MPSVITIPAEAQPSDSFNAEAATNAYLAQIPAAARARSDAYFEGGYWLILWDFLLAVIVYWALLRLGWSARMRGFAEHLTRFARSAEFFLLDSVHAHHFRAYLPADRVRRLLP